MSYTYPGGPDPQAPLTTSTATVFTDGGGTILSPAAPRRPVDWMRHAKGAAWGLATLTIIALFPYARDGGFDGDQPHP